MNDKTLNIKLVAIARDEAAYLPEWVFHHLSFGFDAIEVYVNNTSDKSYQVLENIAKHYPVAATNADKLYRSADNDFQLLAYAEATKKAQTEGFTHVMFLDIDEFWTPADFNTSIKQALTLFNYPQALSLNWFIHCDEERFSSCYKSSMAVLPNAHVKTIFDLTSTWDKVEVHNIVGADVKYTRGDGSSFDFGDSPHCALSDSNCKEHDYFIIHRMYRSQMEYISLLGRGRANKLKLKDNRNGYYLKHKKFSSITFDDALLKKYYSEFDAFIEQCNLLTLIKSSQDFVEQRYHEVVKWANQASVEESQIFERLFEGIDLPNILLIRQQYRLHDEFLNKQAYLANLPSYRHLLSLLLCKVLNVVGLNKVAISVLERSGKYSNQTEDSLIYNLSEKNATSVIEKALIRSKYPTNRYADFYRDLAIEYRKLKQFSLAFAFICKAKENRPDGPIIIQLYDEMLKESTNAHLDTNVNIINVKNNDKTRN